MPQPVTKALPGKAVRAGLTPLRPPREHRLALDQCRAIAVVFRWFYDSVNLVEAMEDPIARRVEAHALYLTRMLARLGYGMEALDGDPKGERLHARCRSCQALAECAHWLEARTGETGDEVPVFCLNRDYLASLPVRDDA
jgi:hypothetical protein